MTAEQEPTPAQALFAPGTLTAFQPVGEPPLNRLARHTTGDEGQLDEHDQRENALRILASHPLEGDANEWVIAGANRSSTVILLPDEYGQNHHPAVFIPKNEPPRYIPRPEDILTPTEAELIQRADRGELVCLTCNTPLCAAKIVSNDYVGVILFCSDSECGFVEY